MRSVHKVRRKSRPEPFILIGRNRPWRWALELRYTLTPLVAAASVVTLLVTLLGLGLAAWLFRMEKFVDHLLGRRAVAKEAGVRATVVARTPRR